ncbi:MAG: hypothetical protein GY861_05475 [bacterium]|nr:hypothetical protein [bacterium]
MNKLQNTDKTGGFPLKSDDLRYIFGTGGVIDAGVYQALSSMLRGFGDNFIVYGCTGTVTISSGWIMLGGELVKVDSHLRVDSWYEKIVTNEDSRSFNDGSGPYNVHQTNRATSTASSGSLRYDGNRIEDVIADGLRSATTNDPGLVEKATDAELDSGTADKYPDALQISAQIGGLKCIVLEIGDWDMDADTQGPDVNHGLGSSWENIRMVDVVIRNDADNVYYNILNNASGGTSIITGSYRFTSTKVILERVPSVFFDDPAFATPPGSNRGWVTIWYESA